MNTFDADGRLAMGQSWFEQFEQKQQERFRPDDFVDAYHKTQRDMAATYSQGYRQNIPTQRPEGWWQSMVLNAVPVLGQGKMFIETLIEKDLATGQRINPYEHAAWTIAGSAMGAGNFVRAGAYSAAGMSGSMATMGGTMGLRAAPMTSKGLPDVYQGVKEASKYLRAMGVSREDRIKYLQSFDVRTISVEKAGDASFGIRFHDFGETARPLGQTLFDTFTPLTSRANLALPPKWNAMTGIAQWQIKPGTTIIRGKVGPQLQYGPQYVGGANQIFVLEPWKYGTLLKP